MASRKKVLYLISCFGHGRGGHFYSLKTISEEVSNDADIEIVSVGVSKSPVFESFDKYSALTGSFPSFSMIISLFKKVRASKVDVIHSFDAHSYFFGRIVSILTGVPIVHTKCGGPSPKKYYPRVNDLILFSKEDQSHFINSRRYRRSKISLVPNRVTKPTQSIEDINSLRQQIKSRPEEKVILRISRFSENYKKSMLGMIQLKTRLCRDGVDAKLVIIGAVQDKKVFSEIKKATHDGGILVTDDKFTLNASRLIDVADVVVGTGRGAMEAAILGKPLLSTTLNCLSPVLVSEQNLTKFVYYNFSPRTDIDVDTSSNYRAIRSLLTDADIYNRHSEFIKKFAITNFDVRSVRAKYLDIYSHARRARLEVFDILLNGYFAFRVFWARRHTARSGDYVS